MEDGTVWVVKSEATHKLLKPEAWAFDECIIDQAEEAGAHTICVQTSDTGKRFTTSMDIFRDKALSFTRGHGAQLALTLKYWQLGNERQMVLMPN
jgi:hypothetical protein